MLRACTAPENPPLGELEVALASVLRTSSRESPTPASATGSTETRTAGCWAPPTNTCPTPETWEIFCARMVLATSNIWLSCIVLEVRATMRMGASAGFTLR
jgi:hypothetical protein